MSTIIYHVLDVKAYKRHDGRDAWFTKFEHEPEKGYSWQYTSVLGDIPLPLKAKMSNLKRKWFLCQIWTARILSIILWLLCVSSFLGCLYFLYLNYQNNEINPFADDALFSLTLRAWEWDGIALLMTIFFGILARRSENYLKLIYRRGYRASTKSRQSSLSSFFSSSLKKRWGGEIPKPTRIQPIRTYKKNVWTAPKRQRRKKNSPAKVEN